MERADILRKQFDTIGVCDMLICRRCKDALYSRGEQLIATDHPLVAADELEEFIADGGFKDAEDGSEPCGCEWCGEIEDLYGIVFR